MKAELMLRNVRLSYPWLFVPTAFTPEQPPRYSANFLIDENSSNFSQIKAMLEQVAREKWGDKAPGILAKLKSQNRLCFRQDEDDGWFVSSSAKARPTVLDSDKTLLTQDSGRIYAGCYVNALVSFWPQDNSFGQRINAELRGVQFYRDGEAFGGGKPASVDDFDDVSADELSTPPITSADTPDMASAMDSWM